VTAIGALIGGVFLVIGCGVLWRAWIRRGWVTEDALIISHNPITDLIAVSLGEPTRFASLPRTGRGLPSPGMRLRVTHPPGKPQGLRRHRNRAVDVAVGIAAVVMGIVALLSPG